MWSPWFSCYNNQIWTLGNWIHMKLLLVVERKDLHVCILLVLYNWKSLSNCKIYKVFGPKIERGNSLGYHTPMANSTLKCRIIILFTARSLCSYANILISFGQLYSNSCYTTFRIATLGMCIACEFHQLWAVRPCIYHIIRHLIKWLIFYRIGHADTVLTVKAIICEPMCEMGLSHNAYICSNMNGYKKNPNLK